MALFCRLPSGGSNVKFACGTLTGNNVNGNTYNVKFDFVPNYVSLMIPRYDGEVRTPAIVYCREKANNFKCNDYSDAIHNYYDGSGGDDMAEITAINDSGMTVFINGYFKDFMWIAWQ